MRQVKNFATILLLSRGVPMIIAGDEVRRTQHGNNNPYCQDNEISWVDWTLAEKHSDIVRFFRELIALRRKHSLLRRGRFFTGEKNARGLPDIAWHGTQLNQPAWSDLGARLLAVTFGGADNDADLHLMMNMGDSIAEFELPSPWGIPGSGCWTRRCRRRMTSRRQARAWISTAATISSTATA